MKKLTLGRQKNCDVVIEDVHKTKGISRQHAVLSIHDDGSCTITDLGSTNKTYVNDRSLQPKQAFYLQSGDRVRLAKHKFNWEEYQRMYGSSRRTQNRSGGRTTQRKTERKEPQNTNRTNAPRQRKTQRKSEAATNVGNNYHEAQALPWNQAEASGAAKSEYKGTVLPPTAMSDFIDSVLPVPGITKNLRLFFSLHIKPVPKIMELIEQTPGQEEVKAYDFFKFALTVYSALLALSFLIFGSMDSEDFAIAFGINSDEHEAQLQLFSLIIVFSLLTYAWLIYKIFTKLVSEKKSFHKFLKLTSFCQGMITIYTGIFLLICYIFVKKSVNYQNDMTSDVAILIYFATFIIVMLLAFRFTITNIRVNKRFWGMSWPKFLFFFFVVGFINGFFIGIIQYVLSSVIIN